MSSRQVMAMQIVLLLLASKFLSITGNELDKQIVALKIKMEKQDEALRQLEKVTKAQNEKIAALSELNENLQQELENHDLEIDMMLNASSDQEEQLENLTAELQNSDSLFQQKIENVTKTWNAKLHNTTNELNAKVQTKIDSQQNLTQNLMAEVCKDMWKDIQKNHNDTSKLNTTLFNNQQQLQSRQSKIENKINTVLEHDGRKVWPLPTGMDKNLPITNHDLIRLEFMGAGGWLGCPDSVCDLRSCPYGVGNYYKDFNSCHGELFRIVVENGGSVQCGDRVRFQYVTWTNWWLGCPSNNRCDKRNCPGSLAQGASFTNGRCNGEIFKIYARGRNLGDTIKNGDFVMIFVPAYVNKYISIQGSAEGADTSLNTCPGSTPPAYFSYSTCSNNVFRIYRKP